MYYSLQITGMGFASVPGNVNIRFACPKGFVEAEGNVINDTEVSFLTPSFEKFGPMQVRKWAENQAEVWYLRDACFYTLTLLSVGALHIDRSIRYHRTTFGTAELPIAAPGFTMCITCSTNHELSIYPPHLADAQQ